ncbi:MAG: enoyl-CoA hydratase/isomerase family protein [Dehalococcoidia bacterium]
MSIRTERDGHILTITIDRPEAMNALAPEMMFGLEDAFTELRDDPGLRVAIVTGAGDRAFCAGADLGRMADRTTRADTRRLKLFSGLDLMKPVVGAINGHCLAGGLGLALLCDVRIASENATFGCMGTARGILPGAGQTVRLPQVVGLGNAMWLLLSAERIPADEALRIGLVNRVVPRGQALAAAHEWASILASRAPLAVKATKESALRAQTLAAADAMRLEGELAAPLMSSEDAQEGIRAFNEKRTPEWKGR